MSREGNLYTEDGTFKDVGERRVCVEQVVGGNYNLYEQTAIAIASHAKMWDAKEGMFQHLLTREWDRNAPDVHRGIHETCIGDEAGVISVWYNGLGWCDVGVTFWREVCETFSLKLDDKHIKHYTFTKKEQTAK